ncbi:MAG: DUF4112 domain-containing protein [Candidatus Levybacteria bacterium]|nr:DUF4112 domain-containing protein [Candidatus Levybacteria bacterium]
MNFHLQIATFLTHLLDEQFKIGKVRFGLDPILGIIPFFGDFLSLGLSVYIFFIAHMLGLPQNKKETMIRNIITDFLIGLIPILGDVSDIFYKANSKNLRLLHEHMEIEVVEGTIIP